MSNITSMFEAIEFIEHNLKEEIAVADIAEAVSYSLYHFCRVFNQVVHHSPYDYLMRRRLSESARELIETDRKITDIAFDYQFNSPETYSRAFKRMFDVQPNQWKKQGQVDRRFLMSRLTLAHIQHVNKGDYLKPVFATKDAFQVAGVMTLVKDEAQEVISQLWDILAQELEGAENVPEPRNYYGLAWYPKDWEKRGLFYMAALEVESSDSLGPVLVTKTIPPLKYARFIHKGPGKDRQLTLDYVYQTWLPKSGKRLAYPLEIECYGQDLRGFDNQEAEWKIYIPIE
jgi:AraC family transcriptional regulator